MYQKVAIRSISPMRLGERHGESEYRGGKHNGGVVQAVTFAYLIYWWVSCYLLALRILRFSAKDLLQKSKRASADAVGALNIEYAAVYIFFLTDFYLSLRIVTS